MYLFLVERLRKQVQHYGRVKEKLQSLAIFLIGLAQEPLTLYHTIPTLKRKFFKNIVGKKENADDQ